MSDVNVRQISRAKLYEVFKTDDLVRFIEDVLYAVTTTIPGDTSGVQTNLDSHIADPSAAHMGTAIGNAPSGGISATTVQSAINELDTEKQPIDATLTAFAALVTAADRLIYATGVDAFALTTFTAFARTLLDDIDATTMRATLGLGSMATQTASGVNITGGTVALASGSLGYATGNGGVVTQVTSKSTGVTLSKICGEITMDGSALAAGTAVSFTLTNTTIAAGDRVLVNHAGAGTFGAYTIDVRSAAGSATVVVRNLTAGSLSEAIVIGFEVFKSAAS